VVISTATALTNKKTEVIGNPSQGGTGSTGLQGPIQYSRSQDLVEQILKQYQKSQNTPNYDPSNPYYNMNNPVSDSLNGPIGVNTGAGLDATGLTPMTNERLLEILKNPDVSRQAIDIKDPDTGPFSLTGFTEDILKSVGSGLSLTWQTAVDSTLGYLTGTSGFTLLSEPIKAMLPGDIGNSLVDNMFGSPVTGLLSAVGVPGSVITYGGSATDGFVNAFKHPLKTTAKIANSPLGKILGFTSAMPDDDLEGYDEVSFRAQTYMKTIWDLFKICAALLPNYIVAVRPFEDRSTVFYGKPHWLYTSGVIPVTTGIINDPAARPIKQPSDESMTQLFNIARRTEDNGQARIKELVEQAAAIDYRNLMAFNQAAEIADPYAIGGSPFQSLSTAKSREEVINATTSSNDSEKDAKFKSSDFGKFLINTLENPASVDPSLPYLLDRVDGGNFAAFLLKIQTAAVLDKDYEARTSKNPKTFVKNVVHTASAFDDLIDSAFYAADKDTFAKKSKEDWQALIVRAFQDYSNSVDANVQNSSSMGEAFWKRITDDNAILPSQLHELLGNTQSLEDNSPVKQLAISDPITFAYRFGWKLSKVPIYIDPASGFGVDKVGDLARKYYDEKYSPVLDSANPKRDFAEAQDVWNDFRKDFPQDPAVKDAFTALYLNTSTDVGNLYDPNSTIAPGLNLDRKFNFVLDLFFRFLWQDPFNRAWVVIVADGQSRGIFTNTDRKWSLDPIIEAWKVFLTDKINIAKETVDPLQTITAPNTRGYMDSHQQPGKDPHYWTANVAPAISKWWNNNVGQLFSILSDTLTGLIGSIRLSIGQLGSALSMTGDMQRQANMLNSIFMDSIYYQAGTDEPGDILRLCDNPFTREYGEPVIEVREPFQRMHFISSYENILYNQIKENFTEVATAVTAVSDGKYPVTVHFDKGIPPDRQVEKTVETGLLWDNAIGSGITGIFQPLLHPLETARSFAKNLTGSSDQLSARRVALYHLKEGLKDIYTGEVTVLGNADIRPHDLMYIADVYERMYGMVEVEQVIHHFTPETGFVTSITPNTLVSINDPVRWTMLSYMYHKMSSYNIRSDVRAFMNIKADRTTAMANAEILTPDNVYKYFGTQMQGAIQWTQGNTAVIRDMGAMFTGGGIKAIRDREAKMNSGFWTDIALKVGTTALAAGSAALITAATGGAGAPLAAGLVLGAGDLALQGWNYVKNNLMDQHGCYIQYLNKDGLPMDAGLGYIQGVAAGSNHTLTLFPNALGIPTTRVNTYEDGKFRITTNDILGALGWTEFESISAYRDTSIFVNNTNSQILKSANPNNEDAVSPDNFYVIKAKVLDIGFYDAETDQLLPNLNGSPRGVIDGDTIEVEILEDVYPFKAGILRKVRLSGIDTYETKYKEATGNTRLNDGEQTKIGFNDLGRMGRDYLFRKFSTEQSRYIVLRASKKNGSTFDKYGRILATIFSNTSADNMSTQSRIDQLYSFASKNPPISMDSYMSDGRPYTLNWEMVMAGLANVYLNDIIYDNDWRQKATGP
jgi:hypothetical protein